MNRKTRRAKGRAVVYDAITATAFRREDVLAETWRLRARHAKRSQTEGMAAARMLALSEATLRAGVDVVIGPNRAGDHSDDWSIGKAGNREVVIDRIDAAGRYLDAAFTHMIAEGQARRQLAETDRLIARYGKLAVPQGSEGPTTQMRDRMKERLADPLERLVDLGRLTADDLSDAREIAAVIRYATSDIRTSSMRFECVSEGDAVATGRTAAEAAEWNGRVHAFVYQPWCRVVGPQMSALVIGLAVEGLSVEALRRRYGMAWGTAVEGARKALLEYRRIRRRYVAGGGMGGAVLIGQVPSNP